VNDLFLTLGIESWKPVLTALLLPPVSLLVLVIVSARLLFWRRATAWLLLLLTVAALWLSACAGVGAWMQRTWMPAPPPLTMERIGELRRTVAAGKAPVAIIVLGGGSERVAPEYGVANLSLNSLERLRYGVWLARETGAPLGYSGGRGHAAQDGAAEAEIAAGIATREYGRALRWVEPRSRDTRENAQLTLPLLRDAGVRQVVLVTNGWHMPRSVRAFREAAAHVNVPMEVIAAPMGLAQRIERPALRWIPSSEGFMLVRAVLKEKIGWWLGA
jgi:uncharacterized SAM-binding protein YcdF (DUF218 family)